MCPLRKTGYVFFEGACPCGAALLTGFASRLGWSAIRSVSGAMIHRLSAFGLEGAAGFYPGGGD
jgi:hypothetical protein